MSLMNDGGSWTPWMRYATPKSWILRNTNGTRTVKVRYKDKAGNVSTTALDNIVLDTLKPTIGTVSPKDDSTIRDQTPTIRANVGDNMTRLSKRYTTLIVNGKVVPKSKYSYKQFSKPRTGQLQYTMARQPHGKRVDVRVIVRDAAGNRTDKRWVFGVR
jgi:uncharacterized protein with von Willebrand factor type A (vWA) domain